MVLPQLQCAACLLRSSTRAQRSVFKLQLKGPCLRKGITSTAIATVAEACGAILGHIIMQLQLVPTVSIVEGGITRHDCRRAQRLLHGAL